jgi:hypothetical protein
MKTLVFLIVALAAIHTAASDTELHLGRFSTGDLTGWKEQTLGLLKSRTTYALARDNDRDVLVAHSSKAASGRIYNLNLDPKEYQTLKWSWKIDHTIKKGDEKTKNGDDFAARVYVVFPRGFFSKTRAICYVWANKLPKGEHVFSPFTTNIITVAMDSGDELAGRWTFHQRNVYEDYKVFFGEEPPRIGAVALMTDTDNTAESAVGYYGDISLVRSSKTTDAKQKEQKELKPKDSSHKEPMLKDLPPKEIKPLMPSPEVPKQDKNVDDSKQKSPNDKEQPLDAKPAAPTAAPPPLNSR